jgi:hypothetical protein
MKGIGRPIQTVEELGELVKLKSEDPGVCSPYLTVYAGPNLCAKLSASALEVNTPARCQGCRRRTPQPRFNISPGIGISVLRTHALPRPPLAGGAKQSFLLLMAHPNTFVVAVLDYFADPWF